MKIESALLKLTAFTLSTVNGSGQSSLPEKPNILFITTDYQAGTDVPWETPLLKMPVLAGMAEEGVILSKHYCTAPVSMPSRYTIITGMYPHYHGEWDNNSVWVPDGTPILMEELRKSGYYTAAVGKMHFFPWDRDVGYDKWISAERKGNSAADSVRQDDYARFLRKAGLTRASYLNLQNSGEIYGVYDWPFADSLHIDHYVGTEASKLIDSKKAGPWFMWVSFNGPHNPWDPPARYSEPYKDAPLPKAVWEKGELAAQPYDYTVLRYNYTRKVSDLLDENPSKRDYYIQQIRAGHYGGLTFIDEQLGKIVQALKETGELDNTVIIFTADHGSHLGDHDLIHKGTHHEKSARVPMVIWFGKNFVKGERSGYSAHVDIMPTILDLAGAPIPESIEGKSLVPMLLGKTEGDDHAVVEIRNNYSWVSDEFIFGIFPSSREEVLVDRINDPNELGNYINDPSYRKIADSLRTLLYNFHPPIRDQFAAGVSHPPLPSTLELGNGEQSQPAKTPYLGGKPFTLEVDFNTETNYRGAFVTFYEGNLQGFELKTDGEKLLIGFRKFGKDTILSTDAKFVMGDNSVLITLDKAGTMTVSINGGKKKKFTTPWPMPLQGGAERYLNGIWFSGKRAPVRFAPIINVIENEEQISVRS